MFNLIPAGRSLRFYALISWMIPGALAVIACFFAFFGSSLITYRGELQRVQDELREKSTVAARRISAELLIGQRGAVQSVSKLLKRELQLNSIEVTSKSPVCTFTAPDSTCLISSQGLITVYQKAPFVTDTYFVGVSTSGPAFWEVLQPKSLLWSTLPIAIMLGFGLLFQRIILRKYFLRPVHALVETSIGDAEPKAHWPTEIREIADHLYRSFKGRDEEVFSQIARGVIHDLRTLIHTPLCAIDLVEEQPPGSEKRLKRLEHLQSVSRQQLPKMKEIIDNTLDGSRDIGIKIAEASVRQTVARAVKTLEGLIEQTKTAVKIEDDLDGMSIPHDSTQLERAITNLIKNGIEACQDGDQDSRRLKAVRVAMRKNSDSVEIDVEDAGPGLPTYHGRTFRPLRSTKAHGSGLGLIVSKKIVEAHGGEILPGSSDILGGAKFTVRLPMNTEAGGL